MEDKFLLLCLKCTQPIHFECVVSEKNAMKGYGLVAYVHQPSGLNKIGFVCCQNGDKEVYHGG